MFDNDNNIEAVKEHAKDIIDKEFGSHRSRIIVFKHIKNNYGIDEKIPVSFSVIGKYSIISILPAGCEAEYNALIRKIEYLIKE